MLLAAVSLIKMSMETGELQQALYSIDVMVKHWEHFKDIWQQGEENKDVFDNLLARLESECRLSQDFIQHNIPFERHSAVFYWKLAELTENSQFFSWCMRGLQSFNKEDWLADIKDNFDSIWLAMTAAKHTNDFLFKTPLSDALEEHADSLLRGEYLPEEAVIGDWESLLNLLEKGLRSDLLRLVVLKMLKLDGEINSAFFQAYGSAISEHKLLSSEDNIINGLFIPLIRKRNIEGLEWLYDFLQKNRDFMDLKSSDDDEPKSFRIRLEDCVNSPAEDEAQPHIESIAALFDIKQKSVDEEVTS
jgi:hypothetical protein